MVDCTYGGRCWEQLPWKAVHPRALSACLLLRKVDHLPVTGQEGANRQKRLSLLFKMMGLFRNKSKGVVHQFIKKGTGPSQNAAVQGTAFLVPSSLELRFPCQMGRCLVHESVNKARKNLLNFVS